MVQTLLMIGQAAIAAWAFTALREANPDLSSSGAFVIAAFAAFVATALPFALFISALRLVAWVRRLKQHSGEFLRRDVQPPRRLSERGAAPHHVIQNADLTRR